MALNNQQHSTHTAALFSNIQQDLEILFASTSESILLIEANGSILAANTVSAMWLGQSAESLSSKNLFQLLTPFGVPIREWVHKAVSKKTIYESDTRIKNRFVHFRLIPITENNKVIRLIIIGRDVTEHKQAEEQLREFTEQIENKVRNRTAQLEALTRKLAEGKRHAELRASLSEHLMKNAQDYSQLLKHLTRELSDIIGDTCLIGLFTSDFTMMEIQALTDRNAKNLPLKWEQILNQPISVEANAIISCILQGERYSGKEITKDIGKKILPAEFFAQLGKNGLKALEVFPLHTGDQHLGLLAMSRDSDKEYYSKEDISFVESLTGTIALAIQNARLFEKLSESQSQLRGLSQNLVQAQETHFRELTGEIHDRIGQDMTAINVNINIIQAILPKTISKDIFLRLADTEGLVQDSVKRMRSLMTELRPPMLDQYGLTATLFWYCEQYQRRTQTQVSIDDQYMKNKRLPSDVEIGLFRISQEALNNITKHANATQVNIELFEEAGEIMMSITDNGNGFDTKNHNANSLEHWGLALMHERARALNGELLIRSVLGQGTQVIVRARMTP